MKYAFAIWTAAAVVALALLTLLFSVAGFARGWLVLSNLIWEMVFAGVLMILVFPFLLDVVGRSYWFRFWYGKKDH